MLSIPSISSTPATSENSIESLATAQGELGDGFFSNLFNELSGDEEQSEPLEELLDEVNSEALTAESLQTDERVNQLLAWLKEQQESGNPLPPDLNVSAETLAKAQSVLALLSDYTVSQAAPVPTAEQGEELSDDLMAQVTHSNSTSKPLPADNSAGLLFQTSSLGGVALAGVDAAGKAVSTPTVSDAGQLVLSQAQGASPALSQQEQAAIAQSELKESALSPKSNTANEWVKQDLILTPAANASIAGGLSEVESSSALELSAPDLSSSKAAAASAVGTTVADNELEAALAELTSALGKEQVSEGGEPDAELTATTIGQTMVLEKGATQLTSAQPALQTAMTPATAIEAALLSTEGEATLVPTEQSALNAELKMAATATGASLLTTPSKGSLAPNETKQGSLSSASVNSEQELSELELKVADSLELSDEGVKPALKPLVASELEHLTSQQRTLHELTGTLPSVEPPSHHPSSSVHQTPAANLGAAQITSPAQAANFTQQLAQAQDKLQILQDKLAPLLGQRLMMMVEKGQQQAEIQLDPPELGSLMVRVQVNTDQQAQVSFVAQNPQAREALEQTLPRLREMFQQQQMELVNAQVSSEQRGQNQQQGQGSSEQRQPYDAQEASAEMPLASQPQQIVLSTGKVDFYA